MVIGCDTGFFKHLLDGHPTALEVWRQAEAKEHHLVLSCISLFELSRLGLKGALPREQAEQLVANLPLACEVVWLSERNCKRALGRPSSSRSSLSLFLSG